VGLHHEKPRGESVEWYTPKRLFDALGVEFDLDVASPLAGPVPWIPARAHLTMREDGAVAPWVGLVWCNPPYGPDARRFAWRMIGHACGLMLLPSRTETHVSQRLLESAGAVCFLRERVFFTNPAGEVLRSPHGSILYAFGEVSIDALERADLGVTFRGRHAIRTAA